MTNVNATWIAEVEEDPLDPDTVIITFPDELIREMGWEIGDVLNWEIEGNVATLTKINPAP